jgi:hypothetical protein
MVWEPLRNQIKPYIKEKIIETTSSNPFSLFIQTKLTKWCRRPQTKPNLYLKPVPCHIKSIFHIYHKCGSSCTKLHKIVDCHSKTFPTNFRQICWNFKVWTRAFSFRVRLLTWGPRVRSSYDNLHKVARCHFKIFSTNFSQIRWNFRVWTRAFSLKVRLSMWGPRVDLGVIIYTK